MTLVHRKVQQVGRGGSFLVSLPKKWCSENGVIGGSEVAIRIAGDKSLILSVTASEERRRRQIEIDFDSASHGGLPRQILSHYLGGAEVIIIGGEMPTGRDKLAARRHIRRMTNKLYGCWMVETAESFEVHVSSEVLRPYSLLEEMFSITRGMLENAVQAFIDEDRELATDVEQMDDEIDRLYFHIVRTLKVFLRDPVMALSDLAQMGGITLLELEDLRICSSYLEKLADAAEEIATSTGGVEVPPQTGREIQKKVGALNSLLLQTLSAFRDKNAVVALEIVRRAGELQPELSSLREHGLPSYVARRLELAVDTVMDVCDLVST